MKRNIEKIVVRVYALIVRDNKILLSDEFWYDTPMTKFPGGGLEPGEGIYDCLNREIKEELNTEITKAIHLLTFDRLILSDFVSSVQVIPVYYLAELKDYSCIDTSNFRFDFHKLEEGAIRHRWIEIDKLQISELTFSGDRVAFDKYVRNSIKPKM